MIEEIIRAGCYRAKCSLNDLAEAMGKTRYRLYSIFKTGDIYLSELRVIDQKLGGDTASRILKEVGGLSAEGAGASDLANQAEMILDLRKRNSDLKDKVIGLMEEIQRLKEGKKGG